jgi:hypothetical protein
MKLLEQLADPAALGDGVWATARYSASVLDLETVVCRFEDHKIRLSPR